MKSKNISISVYDRNNLDRSSSPYLLQHTQNPVWWQEWNDSTIEHARAKKLPLFVSVGYSSCHWCHVMASGAFSDAETADYLNNNFINIKIDREQRPDIDQYLMDFINSQNGRGGWPLNVFMTADLRPIYALTYAPARTNESMLSLKSVAEQVNDYYKSGKYAIPEFKQLVDLPGEVPESELAKKLSKYYDQEYGGFGTGQKFPPHSSLLFLLYQLALDESPSIRTICTKTLDAMLLRGLNDHLQGGIFRYTVDREWTIPHFEKMLYDQAMSLWCYSLAFRIFGKESYKRMAERIMICLKECFESDGLLLTGHDADTDHLEGSTYLWTYDELEQVLTSREFSEFSQTYYISKTGNFEGQNHLLRKNDDRIDDIENKLLALRRMRRQPSIDGKILSGINALVVVALVQAGRCLNNEEAELKAGQLMKNLLAIFWDGKKLRHSYYNGILQDDCYLFDAAAVLAALTMLYENDASWNDSMTSVAEYVESYYDVDSWRESDIADFQKVFASGFDHPVPSSISLVEFARTRYFLLKGKDPVPGEYHEPFKSDFYNVHVMMNNGLFHLFESLRDLPWNELPVNSLRIRGKHETDCFMGTCQPL
jgi:uncharacterized protein